MSYLGAGRSCGCGSSSALYHDSRRRRTLASPTAPSASKLGESQPEPDPDPGKPWSAQPELEPDDVSTVSPRPGAAGSPTAPSPSPVLSSPESASPSPLTPGTSPGELVATSPLAESHAGVS